jgi:hypothetical protein
VRRAEMRDAGSLAKLLSSLGYPQTENFVSTKLMELKEVETASVLVAEINTQIVGFLSLDSQILFHEAAGSGRSWPCALTRIIETRV